MDENTGEITVFTPEDVAREIEKANALSKKVQKDIQVVNGLEKKVKKTRGVPGGMSVDDFMAKFMPEMIPLKRLPKKNCKLCYGTGNLGRNVLTKKYVPCSCTL